MRSTKSMSVSRSRSRGRTPARTPSRSRSVPPAPRKSLSKRRRSKSSASSSVVKLLKQLKATPKKSILTTDSKVGANFVANKRTVLKKQRKFDVLGASCLTEIAGQTTPQDECAWFGHANLPQFLFWKAMFTAILKKLFAQVGVLPHDLSVVPPFVQGNDQVSLITKTDPNAATSNTNYTMTAASLKIEDLAILFATLFSGNALTNTIFQEIHFIPSAGSILKFERLNLVDARISVKATSEMKLQNITLAGGTGDKYTSDNVGAQTLCGYYYKGKGSGAQFISNQQVNQNFTADGINGIINPGTTSIKNLSEPQPGYIFTNVKQEGKIELGPGEIKTSVLKDVFTMRLNNLIRKMVTNPDAITPVLKGGSFAFVALEKMVDDEIGGEAGIKMNYDVQTNIHMYLIPGTQYLTIPSVAQVNP